VETGETWQILKNKNLQGENRKENLIPVMTNASTLAGSVWKRDTAVQSNMNWPH
jgi:hypothetical protein